MRARRGLGAGCKPVADRRVGSTPTAPTTYPLGAMNMPDGVGGIEWILRWLGLVT